MTGTRWHSIGRCLRRELVVCLLCAFALVWPLAASALNQSRSAELEAKLKEAEGDPTVMENMKGEISRQQQMLRRLQTGEQLDDGDLQQVGELPELELPDEANPRVAPGAPELRSLPVAIFDQTEVDVRPGTWGNRNRMNLLRRTLDADQDGFPELIRYVDPGTQRLVRQEEDRNYDGVTDAWSSFEKGALVGRVLDSNDDGNPDIWERYREGRMVSREIDRDDDGVRDAFYDYESTSLVEERHDADNDGRVDLRVSYANRTRVRSEEDQDKDGRIDAWRSYHVVGGAELVSRIEHDKHGRGVADTFDTFEAVRGKALLAKREEDVNGDGEIDITSYYQRGKLVRREILDPDLVPL